MHPNPMCLFGIREVRHLLHRRARHGAEKMKGYPHLRARAPALLLAVEEGRYAGKGAPFEELQ